MTITTISNSVSHGILLGSSNYGLSLTVARTGTINGGGYAVYGPISVSNEALVNNGLIEATRYGVFLGSPGTVLDREDLVARVLQRPFNPLDRSLDMHISRLRRKLAVVEEFVDPIKTIRSAGYLFTVPTLSN